MLRSAAQSLNRLAKGVRHIVRKIAIQITVVPVLLYRSLLCNVVFIGITGSCGKTTTKELILRVLSTKYKGHANRGTCNTLRELVRMILQARPKDKFCIQELTIGGLGETIPIEKQLKMLKPRFGVITNIGTDHISALGSIEAIAEEKGKLVEALSDTGTAILNADDHRVIGMQTRCKGRICTYGLNENAKVRATDIQSNWPDRLSFTVHYKDQSRKIQTQLCGTHWVPCVLAAVSVGLEMDVSLDQIADALKSSPPVPGRMSPVDLLNGITVIRDDRKAPLWTIPASLQFMKDAKAKRRIIVVGTISDYRGDASSKYVKVAKEAIDSTDYVIFVGPWASRCLRARRRPDDTSIVSFPDVDSVIPFMKDFLEPEDLCC